jgi:hypothetical protein
MDSTIGDEEVELAFWDADGVISDLLVDNGEGCKVELFYWFPQVELLLPFGMAIFDLRMKLRSTSLN